MELGESTEDVARREVYEETGLQVRDLKLINVYSGSNHFIKAENGDEFYVVTAAYYSHSFEGEFQMDKTESIKFKFFYPNELPDDIVGSHKEILDGFIEKHYKISEK